jgi:hypothetical protein
LYGFKFLFSSTVEIRGTSELGPYLITGIFLCIEVMWEK